ncbi:MAG: hypothetical protein R6V55_13675 [Desulfovermiculus sp.]
MLEKRQVTGGISRTVFTDVVLLLLATVMGLQTTMSFDHNRESSLPPVDLPQVRSTPEREGQTEIQRPQVTMRKVQGEIHYMYESKKVSRNELVSLLKNKRISHLDLRIDQNTLPELAAFIGLYGDMRQAGVRRISYNVQTKGE